ncbi:hypothetical protein [Pedobacter mucosus]|uniref:hypothetical protein n=1 Tax=Pedobacter mucosus TaxID=2895286 RepID=UPI001EE4D2A7|nr:hypothetical protein [Pedobacter mucosus]UKT63113.1 hypothetical protein LOK61_15220 [Pedobacter mucosus]
MNPNELLIELRKFVLIKSGLRNIDPGHCKFISEYVFHDTKNYVSETTIKRFFGFANTLHKFSLFTLNSLSQYIGYTDWDSFCKDKENETFSTQSVWQDLKLKTQVVNDVSLITKRNNSGVPFKATANRNFFYPDFDYFLKNDYQFTTISAHPGHGKSILLAHLVENFFYSESAPYKNDIILIVSANSINSIIQSGSNLKDWFLKEFKFESVAELVSYFKKRPDKQEGKFVLFIDGVDEYLSKEKYFKIFTEFLHSVEENSFLKIVLILRTNTWVNLQPAITGSAFLTNSWYKGIFYNTDAHSNVPALSLEEILFTLSNIEGKPIIKSNLSPTLLNLFKVPFWLQVYYNLKSENNLLELNNPLLCYELTSFFLEKKIFLSKKSTEKTYLLKKISELILNESNNKQTVDKEKIFAFINLHPEAYSELLLDGIIIEEKRLNASILTEVIRFINTDIYTYFIFIQITEKYNYKTSADFFHYIHLNFTPQNLLRHHLLNWSIRFCINRNEIAQLKNIFKLPFTNTEKNDSFDFICNVSMFELNKQNSHFNRHTIDIEFIDIMVMGRTMSSLYKDTIKAVSNHVLNDDVQIMLHIIECNIALIDIDKVALVNTMQSMKRNYKKLGELFRINPYDLILYFYNNIINKSTEGKSLNEKVVKLCRQISKSEPKKNTALTTLEMLTFELILSTLYAQKNYAECHRFIMAILNEYPSIFYIRHAVFAPILLIQLGQTYLKLNYLKKAQRIIQFLDKIISSEYSFYTQFIIVSFDILKANFHNSTQNYKQALIEINEGLILAIKQEFKLPQISLMLVKVESLKQSDNTEEVSNIIKELLYFLKLHKISMPEYTNLSGGEFEQTFKVLKSFKQ